MHLIRDILDKQALDRNRRKIGRIDGVVMELQENRPPKIVYVEIGGVALAGRLGTSTKRWISTIWAKFGGEQYRLPHRIPWNKAIDVTNGVRFDVSSGETHIFDWQQWLRRNFIRWIPGAGR
jgi:hypothetical protein